MTAGNHECDTRALINTGSSESILNKDKTNASYTYTKNVFRFKFSIVRKGFIKIGKMYSSASMVRVFKFRLRLMVQRRHDKNTIEHFPELSGAPC